MSLNELPSLSGSGSGSEEANRIRRLERVLGYSFSLGEIMGDEYFLSRVDSLNDDKGTLKVTWKVEPSDWEKRCFVKAWSKSFIGDGCENVEHEVS